MPSPPSSAHPATRPVLDAIDRAGYRLTGPRRAVADLIAGRQGSFTAVDLLSDARERRVGIGRATVFRALELLVELGALERIDLPAGGHAYVACEPVHHHHLVCSRCGRTADVPDCGVSEAAADISRRTGYAVEAHRVELYGVCPVCQRGDVRP